MEEVKSKPEDEKIVKVLRGNRRALSNRNKIFLPWKLILLLPTLKIILNSKCDAKTEFCLPEVIGGMFSLLLNLNFTESLELDYRAKEVSF